MKLTLVLRELHRSEIALARFLLRVAERHRVEHEIYHMAHDLAGWSHRHAAEIAAAGEMFGVRLSESPAKTTMLAAAVRKEVSELIGRRPAPGLLLVADLRRIQLKATAVSIDWDLLAQAAQVLREPVLLQLSQGCHPETLRQIDWANTMVKQLSPQVLAN